MAPRASPHPAGPPAPRAVEVVARRAGLDGATATAAGRRIGLDDLVADGLLDRVAAQAVTEIVAGRLDERDLKQLFDPTAVRAGLNRRLRAAPPAAARPTLPPGSALGRYTVRGLLGRGAGGDVYLSRHPDLNVPVALKVAADPAGGDRLRAEAAALARVTHPNVIRLWGIEPLDGWTALILEHVDGGDLGRWLARFGPVGPRTAFRAGLDALHGLRAVHAAGLVHGDVKPANLLGRPDRGFKLADFGTARRPGVAHPGPAAVEGSWPYAAPECFDGPGDQRSDLYSLGLTLYHLLAGRPAVAAAGFADCRAAHRNLTPDPLHWTVPGVGRRASDLIRRMTAADPADRPASASELLAEARRAFRPRGGT